MFKRLIFPLLALVLALGLALPTTPVRAQDGSNPLCNGLSAEDCQILLDAQEQTQGVSLLSVPSWAINLNMTADGETVSVAGNGAITVVPPQGLVAMMSDMGAAPLDQMQMMRDFVNQIDSATIEQWLAETALDVVLNDFSYSAEGDSGAFSGELIIKDSTIYIQLPSPTGAMTWFGQKIEPADLSDLDSSLEELREALNDPEAFPEMDNAMELGLESSEFVTLANQYVTTTRTDEEDLIAFTITFDLLGLLNDPELGVMIADLVNSPAMAEMLEDSATQVTGAQVQLMIEAVKLMIGESTISSTQWVSPDDGYIHAIEVNVSTSLDVSQLSGESTPPVTVSFQAAVKLADFNSVSPDSITVPDSYLPLDAIDSYYPGTASMIASELEPGQTFSGSFDDSSSDQIFGITLEAGSAIAVEVKPSEVADIQVIGPDGFEVAWGEHTGTEPSTFTAEEAGQYLIILKESWGGDYELTLRAQ